MIDNIALYSLYLLLFAIVTTSLVICCKKQNASSFTFCGSMATLLAVVLLASFPIRNKISSPGLSVEPRIDQIEIKQNELMSAVSSLAAIQSIAFSTAIQEGQTPENKKQLELAIGALEKYSTSDAIDKLKTAFGIRK